jgi:predicted O-methyltransferase YrrM
MDALQRRRRESESRLLPRIELEVRHLRNTRLLVDREALLAQLPKGGVVAELGVDDGDFSRRILTRTQPAKLHLVDSWASDRFHEGKARAVRDRFREEIAAGRVEIHRGLSTDVLAEFPDESLDWVYVDSDHSYAITAAELRIASRKLRHGGILAGHDYVTGGWDDGVRYGVVEAVHEFCRREDWEIVYLTAETHRHLSFGLRRMADD